jgi:hypothetical protein
MTFVRIVRLAMLAAMTAGLFAAPLSAQHSTQMMVTATVRPSCQFAIQPNEADAMASARVTCGRSDLRALRVSTDEAARSANLHATRVRETPAFAEVRFALPTVDAVIASTRLTSLPSAAPKPVTVTFQF